MTYKCQITKELKISCFHIPMFSPSVMKTIMVNVSFEMDNICLWKNKTMSVYVYITQYMRKSSKLIRLVYSYEIF